MPTKKSVEDEIQDLERQDEELRQKKAEAVRRLQEEKEAEDLDFVTAYWEQRASENPNDPEVLRARADLLDRANGVKGNGTVVEALPASLSGEVQ